LAVDSGDHRALVNASYVLGRRLTSRCIRTLVARSGAKPTDVSAIEQVLSMSRLSLSQHDAHRVDDRSQCSRASGERA
jgi:hypothetical protein